MAAEAGDAEAQFLRGHSHYFGQHGYPQDRSLSLSDFIQAAESGHADAAVSAGATLFATHNPQNKSKAFELYQNAGELGSLEGWRNIVARYTTGASLLHAGSFWGDPDITMAKTQCKPPNYFCFFTKRLTRNLFCKPLYENLF